MKKQTASLRSCGWTALALALPTLDVLLVARMVYVASVPDLLSPFAAVAVGLLLGFVAGAVFIAGQGNTVLDINIPAFMLFVLLVWMYPSAAKMPARRRANIAKRARATKHGMP